MVADRSHNKQGQAVATITRAPSGFHRRSLGMVKICRSKICQSSRTYISARGLSSGSLSINSQSTRQRVVSSGIKSSFIAFTVLRLFRCGFIPEVVLLSFFLCTVNSVFRKRRKAPVNPGPYILKLTKLAYLHGRDSVIPSMPVLLTYTYIA